MSISVKYMDWRVLVTLLILTCVSAITFRLAYFGTERLLSEDTVWKISTVGIISRVNKQTIVRHSRPVAGEYHNVISQYYFHPNFRLLPSQSSRALLFHARAIEHGYTKFTIDYDVQLSQTPLRHFKKKAELSTSLREKYLKPGKEYNLTLPALATISDMLNSNAQTKQELIHKIFHESQELLKQRNPLYDDLENVLDSRMATTLGRARFMVALSRLNGLPARVVTGFVLDEAFVNQKYYWVEVYSESEHWQSYDPERGYQLTLPNNYIGFDYDKNELLTVEGGTLNSVSYKLQHAPEILASLKLENNNILSVLNFNRLDLDTRQALMRLFVLPFCVVFVVFVRQVLGILPYGVFAAPILALAMVHAELTFALLMTAVVIFMSVMGRGLLPHAMSRVPRVSIILIFVIMSAALSISVLSYFSPDTAGNVILVPTIILAIVVDQFYSFMEKSGKKTALMRLVVTVVVALLCIPVLEFEPLRKFIIGYPEIHLLSVALIILLSVYKGKKLTDYALFKFLKIDHKHKSTKGLKNHTE